MTVELHGITENQLAGRWLVKAKDPFLSGWGKAEGGSSWCAWAFSNLDAAMAFEKLLHNTNFQYIGVVGWPYRPNSAAHLSIYNGDSHVLRSGEFIAVQYGENIMRFRYHPVKSKKGGLIK